MNFSPEASIILAKRADLDGMPHFAEFHLGLDCLQIYHIRDFQNTMINIKAVQNGAIVLLKSVSNVIFSIYLMKYAALEILQSNSVVLHTSISTCYVFYSDHHLANGIFSVAS